MSTHTLTVSQIRTQFLQYMKDKGHAVIPSSSLVPENDPTTLFTGSGMQPMLPYLLGQPHPLGKRIVDSQKCFRSQDIEEVGDNRHTTFFEMLGNWSFGDYFKEEQITWMWNFLIDELKLDPKNFYVTCFAGNETLSVPRDTFSAELWKKLFKAKDIDALISETPDTGIKEGERIFYYSEKKNWWSRMGIPANMGQGEPGGPDSEMFYDFDPKNKDGVHGKEIHEKSLWKDEHCHVNCDCGRFLEIGNNVFMQYKKTAHGFEELPQMNVDHGSGLERYACALRNDPDIFMIDIFDNPRHALERFLVGKSYHHDEKTTYAMRIILDHIRSATFLIGDGVVPGSKDQMYFVRRLVRRAIRFANSIGIQDDFTAIFAESFIDTYKSEYTLLEERKIFIMNELSKEEKKFKITLGNGIKKLNKIIAPTLNNGVIDPSQVITAEVIFDLYQQDGFPYELSIEEIKNIESSHGTSTLSDFIKHFPDFYLTLEKGFNQLKETHSLTSRTASAGKFKGGLGGDGEMEVKYHTATHMLHQVLREVLGESVAQKGSNITPERLRFDFSFERKVTDEEQRKVEAIINQRIQEALPVIREEVSMDEARARGAIGLFGDKYGDMVSIYRIGEGTKRGDTNLFSMEFCGGPHVNNTSELGTFSIQKEEAVSAGVRRIKAILE